MKLDSNTKVRKSSIPVLLPAERVEVGNCVIVNQYDQPCGKLIAVVTEKTDAYVKCQYLNNDKSLSTYNKDGGIEIPSHLFSQITPVFLFGVTIQLVENETDAMYYCEQTSVSKAQYSDGESRKWQEYGGIHEYTARPELLELIFAHKKF